MGASLQAFVYLCTGMHELRGWCFETAVSFLGHDAKNQRTANIRSCSFTPQSVARYTDGCAFFPTVCLILSTARLRPAYQPRSLTGQTSRDVRYFVARACACSYQKYPKMIRLPPHYIHSGNVPPCQLLYNTGLV
jgi:hypothetical protein